jgi:hypothetical protein
VGVWAEWGGWELGWSGVCVGVWGVGMGSGGGDGERAGGACDEPHCESAALTLGQASHSGTHYIRSHSITSYWGGGARQQRLGRGGEGDRKLWKEILTLRELVGHVMRHTVCCRCHCRQQCTVTLLTPGSVQQCRATGICAH